MFWGMTAQNWMLWIMGIYVFTMVVIMQWHNKLPAMNSIQELSSVLNSRGGNIMVLGSMSLIFFTVAIRFTYWFVEKSIEGKVTVGNAIAMSAFTWVTGSAFGGAFTSMVKAMTGENAKARSTDMLGGVDGKVTKTINTSTTVSATAVTDTPPSTDTVAPVVPVPDVPVAPIKLG